jgi:hypothetical protein
LGAEIGELMCSQERSGRSSLRSSPTQRCRPNERRKTGTRTIRRKRRKRRRRITTTTTTTGVFQLRI